MESTHNITVERKFFVVIVDVVGNALILNYINTSLTLKKFSADFNKNKLKRREMTYILNIYKLHLNSTFANTLITIPKEPTTKNKQHLTTLQQDPTPTPTYNSPKSPPH